MVDPSNIVSVALGVLLSISEVLPYIKSIKGNSITDVFYNLIKKQGEIVEEQEHLLQPTTTPTTIPTTTPTMTPTMTPRIPDTIINIDTSKIETILIKSKILESSDKYEMIYIINFIKKNYNKRCLSLSLLNLENKHYLESLNYNVDYDSKIKMYNIHW